MSKALKHISMEDYVREEIEENIKFKLAENKVRAEQELKNLIDDERAHPITYNHYYTDNVQHARVNSIEKLIEGAVDKLGTQNMVNGMHISAIKAALQKGVTVNMDDQACNEALADLRAYYKVRAAQPTEHQPKLTCVGCNEDIRRQRLSSGHRAPSSPRLAHDFHAAGRCRLH